MTTDFDKAMKTAPTSTNKWGYSYDLEHLTGGIQIPCDIDGNVHPDYQKHYETLCALRTSLYHFGG